MICQTNYQTASQIASYISLFQLNKFIKNALLLLLFERNYSCYENGENY